MEITHAYQINGGHAVLCIKVNKISLLQRQWVTFSIQTKNPISFLHRLSPSLLCTCRETPCPTYSIYFNWLESMESLIPV